MVKGPQLVELSRGDQTDIVLEELVGNDNVDAIHIAAILGTVYVRHDLDVIDHDFNRSVIEKSGYEGFNPAKLQTDIDIRVKELLYAKFSGQSWEPHQIKALVEDYVADNGITDEHMAALLGAIMVRDLDAEEAVALTKSYRDSGLTLEVNSRNLKKKKVVDKHSFGGIGDCVSLVLAPLLAAASDDIRVPMMSGRGLGHTGGTLDKLEAIPGYNVNLSPEKIDEVVNNVGCAIFAQTPEITPADGRIYALRDLTNCVMNGGLITASILGKKLAEGLDLLVLDVKTGSGAFYTDQVAAKKIGQFMSNVGTGNGTHTTAFVTDMNQPLAPVAGNLLEVIYSARALQGSSRGKRFMDVVYTLAEDILNRAEVAVPDEFDSMRDYLKSLITKQTAYGKFLDMVEAQSGDVDYVQRISKIDLDHLPPNEIVTEIAPEGSLQSHIITAPKSGYVTAIQLTQVGECIRDLGAGRTHPDDVINPLVGVYFEAELGTFVEEGDPIAYVFHDGKGNPEELSNYFVINSTRVDPPKLIKGYVTPS